MTAIMSVIANLPLYVNFGNVMTMPNLLACILVRLKTGILFPIMIGIISTRHLSILAVM